MNQAILEICLSGLENTAKMMKEQKCKWSFDVASQVSDLREALTLSRESA